MTQIITVTPNPAIDVSTSIGQLLPFTKMRCAPPKRDAGGGGLNVARVVKRLGGQVTALYPVGGATGLLLQQLMNREEVASIAVPTTAETREDFTVFVDATADQYRFVMPGAHLAEPEWQECLRKLETMRPPPTFVVASGSLPPGAPADFFGRVAGIAKRMGAKLIVDTSGPALTSALKGPCYLIKPNLREFRELTGTSAEDEAAQLRAARDLINRGVVEMIALSLGPGGAMLISRDHALRAEGLVIRPASVVGAGDSFVGALVWSLGQGHQPIEALRYAVAAGSAALLNPGTELCKAEDVHRYMQKVVVRSIDPAVAR